MKVHVVKRVELSEKERTTLKEAVAIIVELAEHLDCFYHDEYMSAARILEDIIYHEPWEGEEDE